jgi:hypothetical protein
MSPKEKALELIGNMGFSTGISMDAETGEFRSMYRNQYAKECALVAVDEILNDLKESLEIAEGLHPHAKGLISGSLVAWQKVKIEIEKQ